LLPANNRWQVMHGTEEPAFFRRRRHVKEVEENKSSQIEVFLNSVPMLSSLSREEKLKLASVLEEQKFKAKEKIVEEVHTSLSEILGRGMRACHRILIIFACCDNVLK
jgi:hypothetical protein